MGSGSSGAGAASEASSLSAAEFDALRATFFEAVEAIKGLLRATALAWPPDIVSELEHWAHDWPIHNTRGMYPLKEAYQAGDLDTLEGMGHLGPALETLQAQESHFRPWLEAAGYTWLPWWSGEPPSEGVA